jgi:hypothetical protein
LRLMTLRSLDRICLYSICPWTSQYCSLQFLICSTLVHLHNARPRRAGGMLLQATPYTMSGRQKQSR